MITCPNCQKKNMLGAIFCKDCGVQLVSGDGVMVGRESVRTETNKVPEPVHANSAAPVTPSVPADAKVALYLQEVNEVLALIDREEITLGRAIEGQPIIPDLDLTPYNGYEKGVSRLHASIKIDGNRVTVTDLGSANGTLVNGSKLLPNQSQPIAHGDTLTLGRLQTQVLIRS
jgi:pSer/pThr/pTyr-binding forkhead associated (FHA) protein